MSAIKEVGYANKQKNHGRCFICGSEENLYRIYGEKKFICNNCLDVSQDYGECCICKKNKKIAYDVYTDLKHCDKDDRDYCEEHYPNDDEELSDDQLDIIEKFSKD